ncbi:hypothetical protein DWZ56_04490 [Lachnotalea sp. AF33-28]|nr:hypothetical protein DWZ56_04490 [Lachnotalea sp. AF33-28]
MLRLDSSANCVMLYRESMKAVSAENVEGNILELCEMYLKSGLPGYFVSAPTEEKEGMISERLLYTQANGRVLLGQDTLGRLHFISLPSEYDYPLPVNHTDASRHLVAGAGMYRQNDCGLLPGRFSYSLELESGHREMADENSLSFYQNDFLPVTRTVYGDLELMVSSFAPVNENAFPTGEDDNSVWGPSGCFYTLSAYNRSKKSVRGRLVLKLQNGLLIGREDRRQPDKAAAMHCDGTGEHLIWLAHPELYAAIEMCGGRTAEDFGESPDEIKERRCEAAFELEPGVSKEFHTFIVLGHSPGECREQLAQLYAKTVGQWREIALAFWDTALSAVRPKLPEPAKLTGKTAEFAVRCLIDNFNCIQTNRAGEIIVHWQGAPAHYRGRMWGIDMEPTMVSLLFVFPQLGGRMIRYALKGCLPMGSTYPDHSVPIMLAPIILAGKYLELTGDVAWFRKYSEVCCGLKRLYRKLRELKPQDSCLLPSRYSSDGKVNRRYDFGVNVKAAYALSLYAKLLHALGEEGGEAQIWGEEIRSSLQVMAVKGPFGPQISGGTNLGEQSDFYIKEDIPYYDGEDTASAMAGVYGILPYNNNLWENYRIFAQSLWLTNYEPETGGIRWYPWGGNVDGTSYVSRIISTRQKKEQLEGLDCMFSCAVAENGSLYWWPMGTDHVRKATRCSQGQGFFLWNYLESWLGIRVDAAKRCMYLKPCGIYDNIRITDGQLGAFRFSLEYDRNGSTLSFRFQNLLSYEIMLMIAGEHETSIPVPSKETVEGTVKSFPEACEDLQRKIVYKEAELAGIEGVALTSYGNRLSIRENCGYCCAQLPFVLCNGSGAALEEIRYELSVPSGRKIMKKQESLWDDNFSFLKSSLQTGHIKSVLDGRRQTLHFWMELLPGEKEVWITPIALSFCSMEKGIAERTVHICKYGCHEYHLEESVCLRLIWRQNGQEMQRQLILPIRYDEPKEYKRITREVFGTLEEA